MKLITTLVLILFSTVICAQKTEQGFDINFKPTKGTPRYWVITEKKEDRWYREAYHLPENGLAMKGWYKDSLCKTADGEITWAWPNKKIKSIIHYTNGKKNGSSLQFNEKGYLRDSSNYLNGHLTGIGLGWDEEGYQTDSTNFDGAGNGFTVHWYAGGPPLSMGFWKNDTTKINRWKYYHRNGKLMATEEYTDGKRTSCNCFDEKGVQLDSLQCIESEASFPGGAPGWIKYLEKKLDADVPVRNRAPDGQYMVMMQFVVEADGQLSDIKPLTKFGFGMEDEVIRLLKKSPKWIPAQQYGRKIKAYRKQPVTFVVRR